MRRDKILARILLIFSVANIALAAPAVGREIRLDIIEAALEKRDGKDKSTGGSVSGAAPELSDSDSDASDYFPDDASFHDGPAYPYGVHSWGPVWWRVHSNLVPHNTYHDSGPLSSFASLQHQDSAAESLGMPEGWEPASSVRQDSASSVGSFPQGWEPASPVHQDSASSAGSLPHGWEPAWTVHQDSASSAGQLSQGWEPAAPAHQDSAHELPSSLPHQDSAPDDSPPGSSHQNLVPPKSTLSDKFFNDAMKQKIKVSAGVGVIAGISAGLIYGIHKLVKGTSFSGTYVSALFPSHSSLHTTELSNLFSSVNPLAGILQLLTVF